MSRGRFQACQLTVPEHAHDKEQRGQRNQVKANRQAGPARIDDQGREGNRHGQQGKHATRVPARTVKTDDEREQVEDQGHDPQKGHYGDFLAHLAGDRQQQRAARHGDEQPEQAPRNADTRHGSVARLRSPRFGERFRRSRANSPEPRTYRRRGDERDVSHAPKPDLAREVEQRLKQKRVGHQSKDRPGVRDGIQTIRIAAARIGVPALQQRAGSGEHGKREPDRQTEKREDRDDGTLRVPDIAKHTVGEKGAPRKNGRCDRNGQGRKQQRHMKALAGDG